VVVLEGSNWRLVVTRIDSCIIVLHFRLIVIVYSPYQLFYSEIIYAASVTRLPLPCPCLPECKWFNLYARGGFAAGRGFTAEILHNFAINYYYSVLPP